MAPYDVRFIPSADKALRRLPTLAQIRIAATVAELREKPRPPGCIKLQGDSNLWRIRIGEYRVIYEIHDDVLTVLVVCIARRKDAYRRK